jgi:hypothetical protein
MLDSKAEQEVMLEEQTAEQLEEQAADVHHHHWIHRHLIMEEQEKGICHDNNGESAD